MTRTSLTARQEAFAVAIAAGRPQLDAYEAAGYSVRGTTATLKPKASRLAANKAVRRRVAELRAAAAEEVMWDMKQAARALRRVLDTAETKVIAANEPDELGYLPADVPREATKAMLGAVKQLNELFGVESDHGMPGVTIIDDV